jgi:monovalent cation/hydrogen antiporter
VLSVVGFAVAALGCVILAALLEHRTGLPSAAVLVVIGLVYGVLPGPNVELEPDFILVLVLPLLLYSAALNASLLEIRANLRAVVSLSVVLVLLTAVVTGAAVSAVVPGLTLAAGVALGAAVAPPDPVAALAVGRRAGLPPRLITLIEGEGLLNDATALTAFEVAVAAGLGGEFSFAGAGARFVIAAIGGLAVGLVVAWLVRLVRRRIDDPLIENALSLATPFLAYVPAEQLHVSGILAVVVAGLWLGHQAPVLLSGASRLQTRAVWRLVDFLLEGFVFLLIGNQLPAVLSGLEAYPIGTILAAALASVAAVLVTRPVWLWLSFSLPDRLFARGGPTTLNGAEVLALSWAGTRGIISLAVIFGLPLNFPFRDLLLFCTYVVVVVTLVGGGLMFNRVVRALHLQTDRTEELRVWNDARTAAVDAGLRRLDELTVDQPTLTPLVVPLQRRAAERRQLGPEWVRRLAGSGQDDGAETPAGVALGLRRQMIEAEREELLRWRDAGRLPDAGLRALERELDHEEGLLP